MQIQMRKNAKKVRRTLEKSLSVLVEWTAAETRLLQIKPGTKLDTKQVQRVLARLQEQTARQYVAFYNLQTGYVLITLRG